MDHKFSEIDHVTPLFKFFLVVHLQTHSVKTTKINIFFLFLLNDFFESRVHYMPNYIITDWTLICFNHGLVFLDNNYFFFKIHS